MAKKRLVALFKLFSPSAIVLSRERLDRALIRSQMRVLIEAVRREAAANAIPIYVLEQSQVRETFFNLGCNSKDEIASALAPPFSSSVRLGGHPTGTQATTGRCRLQTPRKHAVRLRARVHRMEQR